MGSAPVKKCNALQARRRLLVGLFAALLPAAVPAQAVPPTADPSAAAPAPLLLFAVEIKTGPGWDSAKPPQEQLHFRDHSLNLRRLREQGHLLMGARYADKGLLVLQAPSLAQAQAWMQQDPAIQARVFGFELHPLNVFYPGQVGAARPAAAAAPAPRSP
jgi:uncharacterized protein YciI